MCWCNNYFGEDKSERRSYQERGGDEVFWTRKTKKTERQINVKTVVLS